MTRDEEFHQNLERARRHLLWLLDNPEEMAAIPSGAVIDLRNSNLKQRIMADTHSERIAFFLCTTEGDQGESGEAVNERGELYGWWLFPDGHLDIRPYRTDELTWDMLNEPGYLRALTEVRA